ncbi:Uncharacterised protein [Mycobacterium tuberculosis]|uniref:Uncharacterized protein n=1 Tax=Mycobacterium tuberculosis TaxID=1773 RepID=A0A916LHP4_MYCTX|nr:Uncharacterised protein [Mycobacterium tuberculosis]
MGLAGALVAVEKLSRRRASTPAADCSIEPRRWGVGAAGAGARADGSLQSTASGQP